MTMRMNTTTTRDTTTMGVMISIQILVMTVMNVITMPLTIMKQDSTKKATIITTVTITRVINMIMLATNLSSTIKDIMTSTTMMKRMLSINIIMVGTITMMMIKMMTPVNITNTIMSIMVIIIMDMNITTMMMTTMTTMTVKKKNIIIMDIMVTTTTQRKMRMRMTVMKNTQVITIITMGKKKKMMMMMTTTMMMRKTGSIITTTTTTTTMVMKKILMKLVLRRKRKMRKAMKLTDTINDKKMRMMKKMTNMRQAPFATIVPSASIVRNVKPSVPVKKETPAITAQAVSIVTSVTFALCARQPVHQGALLMNYQEPYFRHLLLSLSSTSAEASPMEKPKVGGLSHLDHKGQTASDKQFHDSFYQLVPPPTHTHTQEWDSSG